MFGIDFFIALSVIAVGVDVTLGIFLLLRKTKTAISLSIACFLASCVQGFYLASILMPTYFLMSLFSSLYFLSIDLTLGAVLYFTVLYTEQKHNIGIYRTILAVIITVTVFDGLNLLLNAFDGPYKDLVIGYIEHSGKYARYSYDIKPLYIFHLTFSYILTTLIMVQHIKKAVSVPKAYRKQYLLPLFSIVGIICINFIYLLCQNYMDLGSIDYSIVIYSLTAIFMYQHCFYYREHGMNSTLNDLLISRMDQGCFLFDYEDRLTVVSEKMRNFFPDVDLKANMQFKEFLKAININLPSSDIEKNEFSFIYITQNAAEGYRSDVKSIFDKQNKFLGRIITFNQMEGQKDLLTGFTNWNSFKSTINTATIHSKQGQAYAVVCDINNLHEINSVYGTSVGDIALQTLSNLLKKHFPNSSFFIRGTDAYVFLIINCDNENIIIRHLNEISDELNRNNPTDFPFSYQSGISEIEKNENVFDAIDRAIRSMLEKKLLDRSSAHSQIINSLITALHASNVETEHHVVRTRELGRRLGQRLGLTDAQQSDLSLLCLLHDIGKIGVPLEIVNKPEKLTEVEWDAMQTHVEKGYQIALSSNELKNIAEMIRSHHERWDGKGYPDGISKEAIPVLSRIISIVDAYDAMTNDRAYRKALPEAQAREEIRKNAGTQFDPTIATEFLQMLEEENPIKDYPVSQNKVGYTLPNGVDTVMNAKTTRFIRQVKYSRYVLDVNDKIIRVDANFESLTGYSAKDVEALDLHQMDLIYPDDRKEYSLRVEAAFIGHTHAYLEHRIRRKDESPLFVFCFGKRYFDSAELQNRSEILITNMSDSFVATSFMEEERVKATARLKAWENKYRCDSLTGLLTHEAFKNDTETQLLKNNHKILFMMMDLDHFKEYNDTYGHHAGDEYLIMVANAINTALGKDSLACRIGGDEFAATFVINDNDLDAAYVRARIICNSINQILNASKGKSTLSMGVAISDDKLKTFNQLYEAADKALYKAKSDGRSRMARFIDL